jgi:rSAM/selenodomain-associated transferase 2
MIAGAPDGGAGGLHPQRPRLSVVVPTLEAAATLPAVLEALWPAALDGLIGDVVVSDGGSRDGTTALAREAGCTVLEGGRGRGAQIAAGLDAARQPWRLVLHADTVPQTGWERTVDAVLRNAVAARTAFVFRLRFDQSGLMPAAVARMANLRTRLFGLPFGDQGLLIHRDLLQEVGGVRALPLMEDVDLARRLGRHRIALLAARVTTSAERYRRNGWLRQVLANQILLARFLAGADPATLVRAYR